MATYIGDKTDDNANKPETGEAENLHDASSTAPSRGNSTFWAVLKGLLAYILSMCSSDKKLLLW